MKEIRKKEDVESETPENFGLNDVQLEQTYATMKDFLVLLQEQGILLTTTRHSEEINSSESFNLNLR